MNKNFIVIQHIKKTVLSTALAIFCFSACSDKYSVMQSKTTVTLTKAILTDKDTMLIRRKDYSNYSAGGFIYFSAADTAVNVASWRFIDSTDHLKVFYDSAMLPAPVVVNQATIIYVASEDTGRFMLTAILTDRTGAKGVRNIPVHVVLNQPPVPSLKIKVLDAGNGYKKIFVDGSASFVPMGKITKYLFYVDGAETGRYLPTETIFLYSGSHTIGLKVVDDLGVISVVSEQNIIVQ
jgi:hypothetical protein